MTEWERFQRKGHFKIIMFVRNVKFNAICAPPPQSWCSRRKLKEEKEADVIKRPAVCCSKSPEKPELSWWLITLPLTCFFLTAVLISSDGVNKSRWTQIMLSMQKSFHASTVLLRAPLLLLPSQKKNQLLNMMRQSVTLSVTQINSKNEWKCSAKQLYAFLA